MSPPVSVVMAVYNGRRYLVAQIESVLAQLDDADELVIVDDGSSDGSPDLVRSLDSPRVRLFVNPRNLGVIGTFNRGLGLARHELIFLCDQDDLWLPGKKTAFVAEFVRDRKVSVVISDAQVIDGDGIVRSGSYFEDLRGGFAGSLPATLWRSRYLGCAMAVRHSLLRAALPIPAGVPMHDMWLGALGAVFGRVVYVRRPLLQYRRHAANVSPLTSASVPQIIRWRWALLSLLLRRCCAVSLRLHRPAGS